MYINFWYPMIKSDDLRDKPARVKALGLNFALFRDKSGKAHCLSNTCAHRGGSLGDGWCNKNGDGLVCPYHGWEFDGAGKCTAIPSLGFEAKTPGRAKVDGYPVQEKYGIVFAFLGDLPESERPPLYHVAEFGDPAWRANEVLVLEVKYNYERSIENGLDPAHNEYVHPTHGFSGLRPDYHMNPIRVVDDAWGSHFTHIFNAPPLDAKTYGQDARPIAGDMEVHAAHHGPNVLITHIHPTAKNYFHQYFFECPIDEGNTRIFFLNMRNFILDPNLDKRIHERNLAIAGEDIRVLEVTEPVMTPEDNKHEVLVPADAPIGRYRDWLGKFEARGWRIDWKRFMQDRVSRVYAIPSPARRTEKNWPIETLPMLPAEAPDRSIAAV